MNRIVWNEETLKEKGAEIDVPNVEPRGRSAKRLKGEKEKVVEQNQKEKRLCRGCGKLSNHDIRNCPNKV